jgi:hypothetical protein
MNTRKSQNSILFLTTLGVYLGLVFVGATPQVVAQRAAMARTFDIKDEIERKDEFDGNPDIEGLRSLITNALEATISSFIGEVRSSDSDSAGRASLVKPHSLRTVRNFCAEDWIEVTDPLSSYLGGDSINDLHRNLDLGSHWNFSSLPDFLKAQDGPPKQKFCKAFAASTDVDSDGLSIKLSFSRTDEIDAFRLAGYLNDFLYGRAGYFRDNPITKVVYENTRATSDYANLVIITRLPRGSLDTLLAKDAR